jgi:hypothetical protein
MSESSIFNSLDSKDKGSSFWFSFNWKIPRLSEFCGNKLQCTASYRVREMLITQEGHHRYIQRDVNLLLTLTEVTERKFEGPFLHCWLFETSSLNSIYPCLLVQWCSWVLKRSGYVNCRSPEDEGTPAAAYKIKKRLELQEKGYRIWASLGDQWSDLTGPAAGNRTFKLPNPMYFIA